MNQWEETAQTAQENYDSSTPWPEHDAWHSHTYTTINATVEQWLAKYVTDDIIVLNAGSGGSIYKNCENMIHLDIVEKYISKYKNYIVGTVENIALPDASVDGIVCVGSVLNYSDAQKAISEFSRILKKNGFLILEFERSESAEFLFSTNHGQAIFSQKYNYNKQTHLLWMYSEKLIRILLHQYYFSIRKCKRLHILSSLLYRVGLPEEKAAHLMCFDSLTQKISYPFAHNTMLLLTKLV